MASSNHIRSDRNRGDLDRGEGMKYNINLETVGSLMGADTTTGEMIQFAIAERLEALVEMQKPRLVKFEVFNPESTEGGPVIIYIDPYTVDIIQASADFSGFVCLGVSDRRFWYVKDTLSEVLAKLRGDV